MSVEKLSVSFSPETIRRVRRAAEDSGLPLSTWLDRAARHEADLQEARAALERQFAEHGEPSEEDRQRVRERLAEAGVGQEATPEQKAARRRVLERLDALARVEGE